MSDRRETPCNGRVAPLAWRGRVAAERLVEPRPARVLAEAAFLLAAPGGARDRQLLHGARFDVLEVADGHAFGFAARDGYVGYVAADALGAGPEPTHAVAARRTLLFPAPDLKRPPVAALSFGSLLAARPEGRWAETTFAGAPAWVHAAHLRPADAPMRDPAGLATRFLGAPYLWAGNGSEGLDCSGLVQETLSACGIDCPGDSDQQEARVGEPLAQDEPPRRGDLLFWDGHVAIALDPERIVHANAGAMAVSIEGREAAIARIEAQGDGRPTSHRRPPGGPSAGPERRRARGGTYSTARISLRSRIRSTARRSSPRLSTCPPSPSSA